MAAMAAIQAAAMAADYPVKPVRIVVPFAPGGTNDLAARIVAEKFSERFGQSFVVDNRAGANGVVGADIVAHAAPTVIRCWSPRPALRSTRAP